MIITQVLDELLEKAKADHGLRQKLLDTRNSTNPVADFCAIATEHGCSMSVMDMINEGEEFYAEIKRSTNGGGENSPLLVGEDDDYELFLTELDRMNSEGI